ncbi:hypothetical protein K443DRAFT_678234 [Laccaria amethystina LaAM-08-1]|uniref:Uncharacterized protein n=1 Tax=Laccaria amethystina LaAM-08-1 TaxID=1095629 RepID=A0A0C9X9L3_9AGAR|nr:hypothetical protein K443DRAFT_678234 [Laccaria amethystina LaAM-08-1]
MLRLHSVNYHTYCEMIPHLLHAGAWNAPFPFSNTILIQNTAVQIHCKFRPSEISAPFRPRGQTALHQMLLIV